MLRCENNETPDFMAYRMRLKRPKALSYPTESYFGTYHVDQIRALPKANHWLKKKTRGLLVFFFTSPEADEEDRNNRKRQRAAERSGERYEPIAPRFVYVPLEPGHALWVSIPIPLETTVENAIADALWRPISDEFVGILKWYTNFIDDLDLSLNYTVAEPTQQFVHDYNDNVESNTPMGLLINYIGDLKNDGSAHPRRMPPHGFPCIV